MLRLSNNKISSDMGCDDSWPATVPSVVPTGDCFHWSICYIYKANQPISVWVGKVLTQNDGTVLLIANLIADSA